MAPALLTDFRSKALWVADYLRCVLRHEGGGYRAEALRELGERLTADELTQLARWAEEAAEARGATKVGRAAPSYASGLASTATC
jgi:hypothetical protein